MELIRESFNTSISYSNETRIKTLDRGYIESLIVFKTIVNPDSNEKICVVNVFDFTSQKMKEQIIRDSEARFKEMANTAPVMIWIADVDGLFSFVNNIWIEQSGGNAGNQLGMNWLSNVCPEDVLNLLIEYQNALKKKQSFSIEFRFKNKSNNYEWMLLKGKPRFDSERTYLGFIGSCINIQEQKEIEAKITNLNSELIQTINNRDKFFSIISHDLRSPLSGLMGILDILNTSYDSMDNADIKDIISEATIVSKTTYTLLENLLEWSRIQTGKIFYNPENLRINRLVENIYKLYSQNLKNKYINFENLTSDDHLIYADKAMTETVLRNLISNAIKFSHKEGSIKVASVIKDGNIIIGVADSGVGIDDEKLKNLFESELVVSTSGTEKEAGTGLGLVISKEFVEKQSGKIWAESKKNKGSTFYFSIPAAK